ncbi:4,5-DOPA dioxygenase extradiol [Terricaulis sp.]|uniref:4,5-DOPA-extradiol-dioxygenase n=1 Tax=Terricaulis sp. TaxID=2768686 RepID=UPI003782D2D4
MTRAPALFIGHGSPMNAIEDTPSARGWADVARRFERPHSIVMVSAHWVTDGVRIMSNAQPRTIHDFGRGFPQELFDQQYPAPGSPELANATVEKLTAFGAQLDESWGLDHGTWSVLKHMYPEADIPVVQVSLDARRSAAEHYAVGRELAALRDDNVLVMASGNIVHNLPAFFRAPSPEPQPWVASFDALIAGAVANDHEKIVNYTQQSDAAIAAPDWEHFTPVLYTLAAQREGEAPALFNRHYMPGISMTSLAFGLPA